MYVFAVITSVQKNPGRQFRVELCCCTLCTTSGKLINLPEPPFPCLLIRDNNIYLLL